MLEKTNGGTHPKVMRKISDLKLISEAPAKLREKYQVRKAAGSLSMEELIASIKHNGVIFDLVVVEGKYVIAGNRRLTALRAINPEGTIEVSTQDVESYANSDPREIALATNVGLPMHPVDRYEILASLVADGHKPDDLAAHYSLTPLQYAQTMKLAGLAKVIRDDWREGKISSAAAQALALESDIVAQEKLYKKLAKDDGLHPHYIKQKIVGDSSKNVGKFLAFLGAGNLDAGIAEYETQGGVVNRDLFGDDHTVGKNAHLLSVVEHKVGEHLKRFTDDGWSWAIWADQITDRYSHGDETKPFTAEKKARSGVFVLIDREGKVQFELGKIKPGDRQRKQAKAGATASSKSKAGKGAKEPAQPAVTSQALKTRLSIQLRNATQEAMLVVGKSVGGLTEVLAKIIAHQLDHNFTVQQAAADIRKQLPAKTFNGAMADNFDAEDYFANAPKGMLLGAIKDVGLFDQAKGVTKRADLTKFATKHVTPTGWLPQELRTPHYVKPTPKKAAAKK